MADKQAACMPVLHQRRQAMLQLSLEVGFLHPAGLCSKPKRLLARYNMPVRLHRIVGGGFRCVVASGFDCFHGG